MIGDYQLMGCCYCMHVFDNAANYAKHLKKKHKVTVRTNQAGFRHIASINKKKQ